MGDCERLQAPHPCLDQKKKNIFLYAFIYIFDRSGFSLSFLRKLLTRRRRVLWYKG